MPHLTKLCKVNKEAYPLSAQMETNGNMLSAAFEVFMFYSSWVPWAAGQVLSKMFKCAVNKIQYAHRLTSDKRLYLALIHQPFVQKQ